MNTFLKVFGVVCALVIVVGVLIPNDVDVRRSIEIEAPIENIYALTNDLEQWPQWSPWLSADPTIKTKLGDIHSGVGASQSWVGTSGSGQLTFTGSSIEQGVVYDMTFEGDPTVYKAGISYRADGEKVLVTWYMAGKMKPIIIGNYFSLLMDTFVGDSFQQGLDMLKKAAEESVAH